MLVRLAAVVAGLMVGACGSGSLSTAFAGTWAGMLTNNYTESDGGFDGSGSGSNEQLVVTVSGSSAQIVGVCGVVAVGGSVVFTGSGSVATLSSETVACEVTLCPGPSLPGPVPDAGTGAVIYSSGMVTLSNLTPPELTMTLKGKYMVPCANTSGYPEVDVTTTFSGAQ